jgi:hypothetical protein
VDDFSLMDYMLPAMDKRLGPPLKRMKLGGDPSEDFGGGSDPSHSGSGTEREPNYQPLLQQPSGSFSTGIGSIFQEAGLQTPGEDYLETLSAYDPTKQQRLQEDWGFKLPGPVGGEGGFAGSGAAVKKAGEQREQATGMYQRGSEDLRKQYREDILAQIADDISTGDYEFTDLA